MSEELDALSRRSRRRVALDDERSCERCGYHHVDALVTSIRPVLCASCFAADRGHTVVESHHIAAKANSSIVIAIGINEHRHLTSAQRRWPTRTLRNREGSENLRIAAWLRGISDLLTLLAQQIESTE